VQKTLTFKKLCGKKLGLEERRAIVGCFSVTNSASSSILIFSIKKIYKENLVYIHQIKNANRVRFPGGKVLGRPLLAPG